MRWYSFVLNVIAACAIALVGDSSVHANIGLRWWGDVSTEPRGLSDFTIGHEQLTIDLRPLADGQPIRVEVVYLLSNPGPAKQLGLLFVSGQELTGNFVADLDGKSIATRLLAPKDMRSYEERHPQKWLPKMVIPGIDREESYFSIRGSGLDVDPLPVPVAFDVNLPSGGSTLRVRYTARACGADEGKPQVTWHVPYVLAPARSWGSFGVLDVTVQVPEGWEALSMPALERDGSTLHGHFEGLPADAFDFATRAPLPRGYRLAAWLSGVFYVFVWIAGALICWRLGRRLGRYLARFDVAERAMRIKLTSLAVAVALASLWAALVYVSGAELPNRALRAALGKQEAPYFKEKEAGLMCLGILTTVVAFPAGLWITITSTFRIAWRRRDDEEPTEFGLRVTDHRDGGSVSGK